MDFKKHFKNKKIIITGHTGFKGSWLTLWLHSLGAKVFGISKNIPSTPSHFTSLGISKKIKKVKLDLKNYQKLKNVINKNKPDYIFHLAAQSLVKKSYSNTIDTWQSNLIGTVNLLESLKTYKKKITVIIITSDKSYKNLEIKRGYKENDLIGGIDPYGASKSSAEIAIQSYVKSFFISKNKKVSIAVARAGNVIGGGDWSEDRLVPDCVKSWSKNKKVIIRNPNSTRPWQHVLEALSGYLTLAVKLKKNKKKFHGQAFNFGPSTTSSFKVREVIKEMKKNWNLVNWKEIKNKKTFFENNLLKLNSKKAKSYLNWSSKLKFNETIFLTTEWYKNYYSKKFKPIQNSLSQIKFYEKILVNRK